MDKAAKTRYPILDVIGNRWSPRAYSEKRVESEKLASILEAARWAPSCFNEQPWRFIVATQEDPESFNALLNCLLDANKLWAKRAPVLILTTAATTFARNDTHNRHAFHDLGLAVGNLCAQATALQLYVHQMAGFHVDKVREAYQIPHGFEPVTVMAVGYEGQLEDLPEALQSKETGPRVRKPHEELFLKTWGQEYEF